MELGEPRFSETELAALSLFDADFAMFEVRV
jgi:hypothetical protein